VSCCLARNVTGKLLTDNSTIYHDAWLLLNTVTWCRCNSTRFVRLWRLGWRILRCHYVRYSGDRHWCRRIPIPPVAGAAMFYSDLFILWYRVILYFCAMADSILLWRLVSKCAFRPMFDACRITTSERGGQNHRLRCLTRVRTSDAVGATYSRPSVAYWASCRNACAILEPVSMMYCCVWNLLPAND